MMKEKYLVGIDEAGRGAIVGPLVICCVKINRRNLKKLEEIGIKDLNNKIYDSKRLTTIERIFLKRKIENMSEISYCVIQPNEIDKYVNSGDYNELEAKKGMELINKIDPHRESKIIIDSPEKPARFKMRLKKYGDVSKIIVKNKADVSHSVVACASIVAKVIRDEEIMKIYEEVGGILGSGYPTRRVIEYIKSYKRKNGEIPCWVRKSWRVLQKSE